MDVDTQLTRLAAEGRALSDEDRQHSARRAAIAGRQREIVREMRALGETQAAIGARLGITQSRVSQLAQRTALSSGR